MKRGLKIRILILTMMIIMITMIVIAKDYGGL